MRRIPFSGILAISLISAFFLLSQTISAASGALKFRYLDNTTPTLLQRSPLDTLFDGRPPECPPCFNCNLEDFVCHQFGNCTKSSGKCQCPPGFGGEDCSSPLCGSLADGHDRAPRTEKYCGCKDGWEGINCNVCKTDDACRPLMPGGPGGGGGLDGGEGEVNSGAVCYREGLVVRENYQMCDVTNPAIVKQLKDEKPQVTFSCNTEREECGFQFWIDQKESFYCHLDTCAWSVTQDHRRNTTTYECEHIKCRCVPGRMLCGQDGSVDIGDFLDQEIKGPATFKTVSTEGGSPEDGSTFSEPAMNGLISMMFGDDTITLKCGAGECVHYTEVPGYERPVKKINTPLIAGAIAGCALFIAATILLVWYLSRRSAAEMRAGYGPIALSDDEEDENAKLLADHKPAALYFQSVSYRLNGKQILSGIQGAVRPGELMAIMGASGAGKTTFLDLLARKNKRGTVEGDFFVNGEKIPDDEFRSVIGFVDQEDTMLPTLTVHETILDSAMLRLPKEMSPAAKEQKVEDVERQLGIYHIRHQTIGSEDGSSGRGISGGEKRRVGIACELVTSPSILFLDEPTSGLDAYNAFNVVECLVHLVKDYNRTVIFTIHQPRSNIVALFDQLVLLAKGRTVYSGPFDRCQSYFDQIGYSCPPGFNIADYLVDLTMHAGTVHTPIDEDSSLFRSRSGAGRGLTSRASSTIAVKSIPSISNSAGGGADYGSSPSDSLLRPKHKRKTSLKQQQDRQLFTRKKTSEPTVHESPTPRTDDENSLPDTEMDNRQWLRMHRQQGQPPPQILDDPDEVPPPANTATGTDLDILTAAYASSDVAASVHETIHQFVSSAAAANGNSAAASNGQPEGLDDGDSSPLIAPDFVSGRVRGYHKVSIVQQFLILSRRTFRNLYRNPQLLLTHYAIAIVLAVFLGFLFYGLSEDIKGFQNRLGLFFFLLALFAFSTLTSLTVFAPERLLFMRERAKGYYHPIAYFAAKVVFDVVPLRLIPPIIMGSVVYPMTGLIPEGGHFGLFIAFLVLFNLAAAAICLFVGVVFGKNGAVANLIGSLVMLFSLLFGGFLLNRETLGGVGWLQYLSIFHYAFEGLIVNEVKTLSLIDHKYGLDIEVPGSAILSSFGFDNLALRADLLGLGCFGAGFVVLAYISLWALLVEKR